MIAWEEPEEQLWRLVGVTGNREESGVAFADVPGDVGECAAVHDEGYGASVFRILLLNCDTHALWSL